jgi:hypothetical protein
MLAAKKNDSGINHIKQKKTKKTNKQTNKQTNNQTNKQTNKQSKPHPSG